MTHFDESKHPRGQAANAGQFAAKSNTAPGASLADVPLPTFSPADARNVDFTVDVLRDHLSRFPDAPTVREVDDDEDGNTVVEWQRTHSYGGTAWSEGQRAHITDDGELVSLERSIPDGSWHRDDHLSDELGALRLKVNMDRLAMAGIYVAPQDSDAGYSGRKFVGGRVAGSPREQVYDAALIAKNIRGDIRKAVEWGALPGEYAYRTTTSKFSGGQAINVRVEGMPDAKQYVERQDGFPHGRSAHAVEVDRVLETIGNQWNVDDSDSSRDYFDTRYYLHVAIDDERMARFRAEQREVDRQKRAARQRQSPVTSLAEAPAEADP